MDDIVVVYLFIIISMGKYFGTEYHLLLYNGQFFVNGGDLPKKLFNLQRTFSPRKTGVCLKIKMLPALEKAEAS